jgi:hypothetical protein
MGGRAVARLGAALAAALLLLALASARPALATPILAIDTPSAGSVTDHSSVTVSGTTSYTGSSETPAEVTVQIY